MNLKSFGEKMRNIEKFFSAIFQIFRSFDNNAIELLVASEFSFDSSKVYSVFQIFWLVYQMSQSELIINDFSKPLIIEVSQSNKFSIHNFVRDKFEKFFFARFLSKGFL